MTISNTSNNITVTGNSLTTVFDYDFYMGGSASNAILVHTDSGGVQTQIATASFSVTGVTSSTGGTFTYPLSGSPITAGESLTLYRILPVVNNATIANQGNFAPTVVDGEFDYLTMLAQQLTPSGDGGVPYLGGNPTGIPGIFKQVELGTGLSFSGNTLVVSGISGSGSVTQINSGAGLTGGPITGVGTLSLSSITTGFLLANFSGATLAPQGVQLVAGSGVTISSTTTSLTIAAGSGSSGLVFITSSSPTGTTVTVSGISSAYRGLKVIGQGRSTAAGTGHATVQLRFNGDSGNNYARQLMGATGNSTPFADQVTAQSSIIVAEVPKAGDLAGHGNVFEFSVPGYAGTVFSKGVLSHYMGLPDTTIASLYTINIAGVWNSSASITQAEFILSTGNWVTGSFIAVYAYA